MLDFGACPCMFQGNHPKIWFFKGVQTMKCTLWTETLEFWRLKMPNSRFALHGFRRRAEYCFESTVSEERTYWVLRQTRWVLRKNSVSSLWHTNNRLKGTHWVLSPELDEGQKTHWARCLKPCSPKPYSARLPWMSVIVRCLRWAKSPIANR